MRSSKGIFAVLFFIALFTGGCATSVRFTHEEIKEYPLEVQEKITRGEVSPGMTQQQVRYGWGAPNNIKTFDAVDGRSKEEWVYSNMWGYKTRLLFINGKLTDITEGMFLKSGEQKPAQQEKK